MLYDTEVFIPVTPELLRSITRNRDHRDVFNAAHEAIKLPGIDCAEAVCPTPVTADKKGKVFYPFYEALTAPTDGILEIVDNKGVTLGWHVAVWYNEDDLPDDDDYDDPEFD